MTSALSGQWLKLLLEQAPLSAFEDHRAAGLAAGSEGVGEQFRMALRLREELDELRRREAELAALFKTANDLIAVRDLERVLEAIVARGQELLRCDVAYLSVVDAGGEDLYVRAAAGALSPTFPGTRVSLGVGVGGRVADSRRPYQVSDYQHEPDMRHTTALDQVVGDEGLVTLLGVPIEINGRLIGVLFAANRFVRPFQPPEVTLMASLAANAAVALENARLFSEAQSALEELTGAYDVIREQATVTERAVEVHGTITDLVLRGGDVTAVAAALVDVLGGSVVITDESASLLRSSSGSWAAPTQLPPEVLAHLQEPAPDAPPTRRLLGGWHITSVRAGNQTLGALVMFRDPALSAAEVRILERASQAVAVLLLVERAQLEAQRSNTSRLLRELVDPTEPAARAVTEEMLRRLRRHGLGSGPIVIVAVDATSDMPQALPALDRLLRGPYTGLAASHSGGLYLVARTDEVLRLRMDVSAALSDVGLPDITVVSAGPVADLAGVASAYRSASRAVPMLRNLDRRGTVTSAESLALYSALLGDADLRALEEFLHAQIGALVAYDRERDGKLCATVLAYLDHDKSPKLAASHLHLHTNTVAQRMLRATRLLGNDWKQSDRSLEVHVALRLHGLRAQG